MLSTEILQELSAVTHITTSPEDLHTYGKDWLADYQPRPSVVCFPQSTSEVQAVVTLCAKHALKIVPSGGRTGLSGGATATAGEVVISLRRMNKILSVNPEERLLEAEAGAITQQIQEAASKHDLFFPIDFASKGSSQIGGNVATNAGGIRVIRWGLTRAWVASLEVVLPNGTILTCGANLVKDQAGYDLKQLFIGSEGTLGIITKVTVRLAPPPPPSTRIWASIPSYEQASRLLHNLKVARFDIAMFELVLAQALQPVITFKQKRNPINQPAPAYILLEVGLGAGQSERERLEEFLAGEIESEILIDLVMSESGAQADELLSLRESIPETLSSHFSIHKNDISVLPSLMGSFLNQALSVAAQHEPTFVPAVFGHCGDGNIHLNFLKPEGLAVSEFFERCHTLDAIMFQVVQSFRGSVAAEHGVGILKREFLPLTRTPEEIAMMRLLKQAIDPQGIMNPGKILPE